MAKRRVGEPVTFTKDDQEIQFSYNNAVVISLTIENYDVCCILIDNESSANILYYNAFVKMRISPDQLGKVDSPLVDFIADAVQVEGAITLSIKMGQYHR